MTARRGTAAGARTPGTHKPVTRAPISVCATAFGVLAFVAPQMPALAAETSNPAHAIAERFAGTAASKATTKTPTGQPAPAKTAQVDSARADAERRAAEQQRAYEEDMLARARAEAEARLKADLANEQDTARERAAAEAKAREDEQKARQKQAEADAQRRALEAKAQAEEEARQRAATEGLSRQREQEARTLAERLRAARRAREEERARAAAEITTNAEMEARVARARAALRQRTERLSDRLATIKTERERATAELARKLTTGSNGEQGTSPPETFEHPRDTAAMPPADIGRPAASTDGSRVTVLIVMKPGSRGIRRWNKTADPMLCIDGACYIGNGPAEPARRISRRKAFGPGVALGERAGACNNTLTCVFRGVDMRSDFAWIQPVDLRIVRHDRREARRVTADPTCGFTSGRLTCQQTVEAADYRAWIIPEDVAEAAGPEALHAALESGLSGRVVARSREH